MIELQKRKPGPHEDIKSALRELVEHLRRDAQVVEDPRASALFVASAEVIHGLAVALEHYQIDTKLP